MNRKLLITVVAFLLSMQVLSAQTTSHYYVSSSIGSDSNVGTAGAPFRTLQKCVDLWDDTTQVICNCSGTFNEEVVVRNSGPDADHRSGLIAWDTDNDGDRTDETFILDGQGTRNIAIDVSSSARPDNVEIGWLTIRNYEPIDKEMKGIKLRCVGGDGCSDWWIHDNTFEKLAKHSNPGASHIVIQPQHAPGLLVERNRFDSAGAYIMRYIQGNGITFRDNYVRTIAAGIEAWGSPDSLHILNNVFVADGNSRNDPDNPDDCRGPASVVFTSNVQHGLIKGNVFIDCASCVRITLSEQVGVRDNAHHVIAENYFHRSDNVCDELSSVIVLADCSDTSKSGDSIVVRDIVVRNNVIRYSGNRTSHRGAAIQLSAGHPYPFTSNWKIFNNTIHGFKWGIRADECTKGGIAWPYQLNGIEIKNNVFSGIWDAFYSLERFGPWSNNKTPSNWVSDYNVFDSINSFEWNTDYSLAQWQNTTGQDSHSALAAPSFIAGDSTFRLSAFDTVAQNQGASLGIVLQDMTGLPRPMGDDWDIGAHEVLDKRILFVDATSGDNANFGTKSKPFRSLQTALNHWDGTNQFELRAAGTFSEELTLAHGGPNADSVNLIAPWDTDNDGDISDETFVLDGGGLLAVALRTDSATSPDFVKINGVAFQNYAPSHCDSGTESRFLRLKGTQADPLVGWHVVGNSFDGLAKDCDPDGRQSGIYTRWVEDLVVEQNSFDSIGGFVLNSVRSQNVAFTENDVRLIGFGVKAGNRVDSFTVAENVFVGDGNGANGVGGSECRREWSVELVNGVQYGLVSENVFYGSSGGVLLKTNERGSRKNAHHVIEKNRVYLNDGACNPRRPGIFISDVSDVTDGGDSIWVEDVLIRNNVIAFAGERDSSGAAIKLKSGHPYSYSNDIRVYNNTIVGFDQGMKVVGGKDDLGDAYEHQLRGVLVKNNLFSEIGDAQLKFERSVFGTSLPLGWESDYNVYGNADRFRWKGGKALSKWRSKSGQDAHSVLCIAVFESGDTVYHLSNTDVCAVESGTGLAEVLEDIDCDSRPNGLLYDAGADERVTGTLARGVIGRGSAGVGGSAVELRVTPQPIESRGRIGFAVESGSAVSVRVYDSRGRVVATLLDGVELGSGLHEVLWERGELASGFYTIEVTRSGGEAERLKVVVVE